MKFTLVDGTSPSDGWKDDTASFLCVPLLFDAAAMLHASSVSDGHLHMRNRQWRQQAVGHLHTFAAGALIRFIDVLLMHSEIEGQIYRHVSAEILGDRLSERSGRARSHQSEIYSCFYSGYII
jgi:hypothetical protein